jgi:hypothetical protein
MTVDTHDTEPSGVDVIVRFHDPDRFEELRAALLCLIGQSYRPLRVVLVTQRFPKAALAELECRLRPYRQIDPSLAFEAVPYERTEGLPDARAALINAGIAAARGRYLAVLDYDDTLYPHAYAVLVNELHASGAVLAFGGIALKSVTMDPSVPLGLAFARLPRAPGGGLVDTFRNAFCPVHGMLLDRLRIAPEDLRVDEGLPIYEDYEWHLRLGVRYLISYAALDQVIGDYRFKGDGSNTVLLRGSKDAERQAFWEHYAARIEQRRKTLPIEPAVQARLGIEPPRPGLTIRGLLDLLHAGELSLRPAPRLMLRTPAYRSQDLSYY